MSTEQYTEYIKQTDGSWVKQHPETDASQIDDILQNYELALAPSFEPNTAYENGLKYNKLGGFCLLNFSIIGQLASQEYITIMTLPSNCRPNKNIIGVGSAGVNEWIQIRVEPGGAVVIWATKATTYASGTVEFYVR